jgi:hypothetical protein
MLGSIVAGRGNGNWVSHRALGATAKPSAIVSEIAAIDRPILFDKNFFPTNFLSTAQHIGNSTTASPTRRPKSHDLYELPGASSLVKKNRVIAGKSPANNT